MKTQESWADELKKRLEGLGLQIACVVLDATFLCLWTIVQYLLNSLVTRLDLSGIDLWVLLAFQVAFAVATLVPVLIYIYVDLQVMILRARREIKLQSKLD